MSARTRTIGWVIVVLVVISSPWLYLQAQRTFNVWWQPPEAIETYLRAHTPLGTPEPVVREWLRSRGANPDTFRYAMPDGAIRYECDLHRHWFVFWEEVSAFYTFDASGHLTGIHVRKDVDGL